MKIPVIGKNAQEDTIWQYFKSSNTFYESRDVVAPLKKHRLCDNKKQHIETHLNQGVEFSY